LKQFETKMKQKLSTIILTLLFTFTAYSQPFEGGFFVGLSASQVDGDTYSGYNKLGITAGGYITKDINRQSNWKAELRYIQRGAYNKGNVQNPSLYKLTLHYAEIPLMCQLEVIEKVVLDLGVAPDIYLFHSEEDEYGDLPQDDYPAFHRFGLGGLVGANYKLTENIIAGARFNYSIIPIRDHPSGQTYLLNRGQYSNVVSLSIYYHFE
jgi:hypothetical protein